MIAGRQLWELVVEEARAERTQRKTYIRFVLLR
jgi:hypothetical protein